MAALRWRWSVEGGGAAAEALDVFAERFAGWMQAHRGSHEAFLALEADRPIGMAWLAATGRLPDPGTQGAVVGEIQSVYVVPDLRSAGCGSDLVRAVIERARSWGMSALSVRPSRKSVEFYSRLGFAGDRALMHLAFEA